MLRALPLPAFQDNYIWLLVAPSGEALVVDPGEAAPVQRAVADGIRPVAIVLTHHHADHVGGAQAVADQFSIPCYAPMDERITAATQRVAGGDRVQVPELDLSLDVIGVPGHTLSHVAFYGAGHLFCGDTLFSMGCGRMFEGEPSQFIASLDRLAALPANTAVCCGHEYTQANGVFSQAVEPHNPIRDQRLAQVKALRTRGLPSLPSTLGSERDCNPFLRLDQPGLLASLSARLGHTPQDRSAAFAALREWKDTFKP